MLVRYAVETSSTDFAEKFEKLIERYNSGSRNIEALSQELPRARRGCVRSGEVIRLKISADI